MGGTACCGSLALSCLFIPTFPSVSMPLAQDQADWLLFMLRQHRAELCFFLKFGFLFRGREPCVYIRGRARERVRQGLARRFPPGGDLSTPGLSTTSCPGHRPWPLSQSEVKRKAAREQEPRTAPAAELTSAPRWASPTAISGLF